MTNVTVQRAVCSYLLPALVGFMLGAVIVTFSPASTDGENGISSSTSGWFGPYDAGQRKRNVLSRFGVADQTETDGDSFGEDYFDEASTHHKPDAAKTRKPTPNQKPKSQPSPSPHAVTKEVEDEEADEGVPVEPAVSDKPSNTQQETENNDNNNRNVIDLEHIMDDLGPTPDWLENTAIVTLATGDANARNAITLMKSLRDVRTRVPNLIVLLARGGVGSTDCHNTTWKAQQGRADVTCHSEITIAPEIASSQYLATLERMHVKYQVVDPIPETNYTRQIAGGRQIFWGMAFNKLLVFNMTQYKKLLWMDGDAYVVKNIDHLMKEPMLTGAMVTACCSGNAPAYAGGGIWVVEPSASLYADLMDFISKPVPGTDNEPWYWGDMQVVRHYFGSPPKPGEPEPLWPAINDGYHGYAPGLHYMPAYINMTQKEFDDYIDTWLDRKKPRKEGFIPELWDGKRPAWRALDIRYDQCVGHFQCAPDRDAPDTVFSVHFSCLHDIQKPGWYEDEHSLMYNLYTFSEGYTRYWFLRWYATYTSAHGRFPPPYWEGPPVPGHNETHDDIVYGNRVRRDKGELT